MSSDQAEPIDMESRGEEVMPLSDAIKSVVEQFLRNAPQSLQPAIGWEMDYARLTDADAAGWHEFTVKFRRSDS